MSVIKNVLTLFIVVMCLSGFSQGVAINETDAAPHPSAILDVFSVNKGVLVPRMTQTERESIANPAQGLLVFQTDDAPGYYYFDGVLWVRMAEDLSRTKREYYFYAPGESRSSVFFYQSGSDLPTAAPGMAYDTSSNLLPYLVGAAISIKQLTLSHLGYYNNASPVSGNQMKVQIYKYNLGSSPNPVLAGEIDVTLGGTAGSTDYNSVAESITIPVSGIDINQGDLFGVFVQGDNTSNHIYGIRNCTIVLQAEER